jgi:hypothetical protein
MNAVLTALSLLQTNKSENQSLPGLSQFTNEQMILIRFSHVRKFDLIYRVEKP